jgi:uncharacterized membrane protein YraQ (UPF0718 family)
MEALLLNTLVDTIKYFATIMAELAVLFIAISSVIAFVLMYLPQDKLRKWLSGKGILGNIMAVLFGAVTRFCACSTVPITLGLLQAGVPFGTVMSFVIASPLIDPLVFIMLGTFMWWKTAVMFFLITSIISVAAGVILEKIGWADQVKRVRIKGDGHEGTEEIPKELKQKVKSPF